MPRKKEDIGPIRKRIAANIKRYRTAGGWSAEECAQWIEVSAATWYHWENGNRSPDIDKLDDLAECLGVTVADLVS